MKKLKYIVYNATAKSRRIFGCGGCYSLAILFRDLKSVGADVYLSHRAFNAPGLTPYEEKDFLENNEVNLNECIVIYPEVTSGNPIGAKYIVRWLLHWPDYFTPVSDSWNKETDLFFAYQNWQKLKSEEMGYRVDGMLSSFSVNHQIFKDLGRTRSGACFTQRKGPLKGSKINDLPEGAEDISHVTSRGNLDALAHAFNKYEDFYCFDEQSHLSVLAALCGCNSIVASQSTTREEYFKGRPGHFKYGIAYGMEDIEHAKSTKGLVKNVCLEEEERCVQTVKDFVAFTQKKYN